MMTTLTQPRMMAAAGLLLLAAGLLWGAFRDEKPERLPPGWEPVNDRLASSAADYTAGAGADVSAVAGQASAGGGQSGGSGGSAGGDMHDAAAPVQSDAAEAAGTDASGTEDVPSSADGKDAPAAAGGFDINRATAAEWDELPGIGPAKAQAIVDDRERNGPFRSIDDLARVKGIGPKLLERIREAIEARNAS